MMKLKNRPAPPRGQSNDQRDKATQQTAFDEVQKIRHIEPVQLRSAVFLKRRPSDWLFDFPA